MAIQYLVGKEAASAASTTQVYKATHDVDGNRLPYMYRSFISFNYGGKWIEDFGFISVTENNAISRNLYASFTDNTTESSIFDGQIYWSTHWDTNTLSLRLATDGVTAYELGEFQHWFQPGIIRELILAEHPHRAALARISDPPTYNLIPFKQAQDVIIAGKIYKTNTTCYKGFIVINFVMDDPFWYSISNTLCAQLYDGTYDAQLWKNANGEMEQILDSKDALKVIQEDGLPVIDQIYQYDENGQPTTTTSIIIGSEDTLAFAPYMEHDRYGSYLSASGFNNAQDGAEVNYGHVAYGLLSRVSEPATITIKSGSNNAANFYYAGTAPECPVLHFTLTPHINATTKYIDSPRNKYSSPNEPYDTIYIESTTTQYMRYSTPGLWTAYNQAIEVLTTVQKNIAAYTWEDVRTLIRERVRHYLVRNHVVAAINAQSSSITASNILAVINATVAFLDNCSATLTIDCKTGIVTGQFTYIPYNSTQQTLSENASDMIKSNYLKIVDRNYPNDEGYIEMWSETKPQASHRIWHNSENNLTNFYMTYKNRYL